MTAAKFATKAAAEQVAARFPLAGAFYVGPAFVKAMGVPAVGWYVGFPQNVSRRLVTTEEAA